ncbi:5-oxoprolinase subunit B family protein [Ferrimonas senticii]|uniref:5-oxoprolinase subunit B family protein n=1 Tax=Ferrimonas senticii TaxID=394566 RepID=UPI0003FC2606|nr:allophanate hydrolase subunit 1 [Ferrimonas senticii]
MSDDHPAPAASTEWQFIIEPMAEGALLLRWPTDGVDNHRQIAELQQRLSQLPWLDDVVAAPTSLALIGASQCDLQHRLQLWLKQQPQRQPRTTRRHRLPVCYHPSLGLDLDDIAAHCQLSVAELIHRHLAGRYRVAATGFRPGFAHLDGLDSRLQLPRRATPRLQVPAGSVAIAEHYSGIYPQSGPAGWHLLGACPLPLLDISAATPCRLQLGDSVEFYPIDFDVYQQQCEQQR